MKVKSDNPTAQNIKAIDLFCGAGGLTHGLAKSGIRVIAGIDTDPLCRFAYEVNNHDAKFIKQDVAKVTAEQLNSLWGKHGIRLLAGCAPCQPFSSYSQARNIEQDERYSLLGEFQRLVRETKPELVTMENVPSVMKNDVFLLFVRSLRAQGYKCQIEVAKCELYGIPQKRRRLVLLASRIGIAPSLQPLSEEHVTIKTSFYGLSKIRAGEKCSMDSLHRSASLSDLNLQRIKASKPGGTWRDWPKKLRLKCHIKETGKGYTPVYGRLAWDDIAPTITTQCYNYGSGRFGHPDQNRPISMREAAILQSFPIDYRFEKPEINISLRDLARMIGNAVPVNLGVAIGKSFMQHVETRYAR